MSLDYTTRPANAQDYEFLFELKKAAEYDAIKAVFGWDEQIQRALHHQEWHQAKPTIIEREGRPVGSYLLEHHSDHLYFGRFFLLPEWHGKGIGSQVLNQVITQADQLRLPIKLCYLQGNRVGSLYQRLGFKRVSHNEQFVFMLRDVGV
ncbi:acetyltransferase [Vibrio variabilis]|uniref:Acetyltransferase n=1 Tax=Vibrio variabilis TaxID=990271 RepID=A0ABR4YF00_9VIBR|nr:GNAT family N-acetyltransferase [Vibrio variabilis]KHA62044.1 acetyltransferase [Vibrio variabilis]